MAIIDNLISYWKLDESSGDAADAHGSNTLVNTGTPYGTGKINNGAAFDADGKLGDADIAAFDFGATDPFSISCWVNPTNDVNCYIASKFFATVSEYGWYLRITGAAGAKKIRFNHASNNLIDETILVDGSTSITTGSWFHVVMTYSGSGTAAGVNLYVNGAGETENVIFDALGTVPANTVAFNLGNANNATASAMDGVLDEFGIWSRELTSGEVTSLYNSGNALAYPFTVAGAVNHILLMGV